MRYILATVDLDDIEIEKYDNTMLINISETAYNILTELTLNQITNIIHQIIIKLF